MTSERLAQVIVHIDAADLGPRRPVGVLRLAGRRGDAVVFTYARSWLRHDDAFAIDPRLPLEERDQFVDGLPGILADTAPDRWGRLLLERREAALAAQEGRRPRRLEEWDFLLGVSDSGRRGAVRLTAGPNDAIFIDSRDNAVPPFARLRRLEDAARAIEGDVGSRDRAVLDEEVALLLAPGSSLGGARPKATFGAEDGSLWMAKFPSQVDTRDVGAWEFVFAELAQRAGIMVPEHRLLRLSPAGHTYAARLFDRTEGGRRLYSSAMTLAGRHDGEEAGYPEIAMAIADHGEARALEIDLEQLFRRVAFNVMVANRDDHLRNHGFLRGPRGWRIAPAFDLNPAPEKRDHALSLDGDTTDPRLDVVRASVEWYRLTVSRADQIVAEVGSAVRSWPEVVRTMDLPRSEVELVTAAFGV